MNCTSTAIVLKSNLCITTKLFCNLVVVYVLVNMTQACIERSGRHLFTALPWFHLRS